MELAVKLDGYLSPMGLLLLYRFSKGYPGIAHILMYINTIAIVSIIL